MTTATLIRGIVNFINGTVITDSTECEALLSFDDRSVPAPLDKFYFAFLIGEDHVSVENTETEDCCQLIRMTVSMNCYAPPGESAIAVCAYAENVLERVNVQYAGMMSGYSIGKAVIDGYLKALKIPCKMYFQYEQCPAFNVSDSILRPFADFLCKTHANDASVHLSIAEREKLSAPVATGTYTGLGAYDSVTVTLGFAPKLVAVFPLNAAAVALDAAHSAVKCSFDVAFPDGGNNRLIVTANGFTVAPNEAVTSGGAARTLNENGVTYCYVAVR